MRDIAWLPGYTDGGVGGRRVLAARTESAKLPPDHGIRFQFLAQGKGRRRTDLRE
jgi:hypothetical protein